MLSNFMQFDYFACLMQVTFKHEGKQANVLILWLSFWGWKWKIGWGIGNIEMFENDNKYDKKDEYVEIRGIGDRWMIKLWFGTYGFEI